jgi:uncharacterized protein (TIGR02596 family)
MRTTKPALSVSPHLRVSASSPPAFSLIELLVVIAIFGIMAAVTLPSIGSVNQASKINRAGSILGDQIILARQEAAAKNRDIEIRIINVTDPMYPGYRAVQLWLVDDSGTNKSPLGKIQRLPEGVIISSNASLSPLLSADSVVGGATNSANFGALGNCKYQGFRIRSSGVPAAEVNTSNNFLTVQSTKETAAPPVNYYTIRVNPISGRITIHRP